MKQTSFKINDPKFDYEINGNAFGNNNYEMTNWQALEFIDRAKKLLCDKSDVAKQDRSLVNKTQKIAMPNFLQQAQMLEWAGVSFGEDNNYLI